MKILRILISVLLFSVSSGSAENRIKREGQLVYSIDGTNIIFPHSEKLDWKKVEKKENFEKYIRIIEGNYPQFKKLEKVPIVERYTEIGDFILITGGWNPPFPEGSFFVVIEKNTLNYIGHSLDKNSR